MSKKGKEEVFQYAREVTSLGPYFRQHYLPILRTETRKIICSLYQ